LTLVKPIQHEQAGSGFTALKTAHFLFSFSPDLKKSFYHTGSQVVLKAHLASGELPL